jgi:serine/threonine-protein kinase
MRLQEANRVEVERRAAAALQQSQAESEAARRKALFDAAKATFAGIADEIADTIEAAAPAARVVRGGAHCWEMTLGRATLSLSLPKQASAALEKDPTGPAFEVIAYAKLTLRVPPDRRGYEGRSHSLWFFDAVEAGRFGWFETAFMHFAMLARSSQTDPFALCPT